MDQLIQAFGIDGKLIVVQIINFAILLAALSYFLYKPVLQFLDEREEKIKQGIKDAEAAAAAKSNAEAEKQNIVAAANTEAEAVVNRATTHATEKADAILAAANAKAAQAMADAEAKGRDRAQQIEKESEAQVAKLAVLAAEKVLRQKQS